MRTLRACGCVVERGQDCAAHPLPSKVRAPRAQRGYGAEHDRTRRAGLSAAYGQTCSRYGVDPLCPGPMLRGQALDLDHTDDRQGYRGFAHAACNRRAGAQSRAR